MGFKYCGGLSSLIVSLVMVSALSAQSDSKETDSTSASIWKVSDEAADMGFSKSDLDKINEKMSSLVEDGSAVGHSTLVLKDGKEVFFGAWGQQNRAKKTPVSRDTIFRIYSMSKPITSVAAMQLVEQGKLKIDSPVSDYLPEFKELKVLEDGKEVEPKRVMKVRDLLRHTSGLTYGFFGNTEIDKRYQRALILLTDPTIEKTVTKLSRIPLLHHPGTQFHYSVSTDVLGRVIEVASGESFDQYLNKNIFEPLKMQDTHFTLPGEKLDRFAELYKPAGGGKLSPANAISSARFVSSENTYYSGGGGLCSTIDDYARFSEMLVNKGTLDGKKIIEEKTLKEMWTNQLADIERKSRSFKFGLGFRISPQGDYSWGGAAGTRFWTQPEKGLTIVYMVQIQPYRGKKYGEFVRDTVYGALKDDSKKSKK